MLEQATTAESLFAKQTVYLLRNVLNLWMTKASLYTKHLKMLRTVSQK